MRVLTREQRTALKSVYDRDWDKPETYLKFRRTVYNSLGDCIMVPFGNGKNYMHLGIELDGYIHS